MQRTTCVSLRKHFLVNDDYVHPWRNMNVQKIKEKRNKNKSGKAVTFYNLMEIYFFRKSVYRPISRVNYKIMNSWLKKLFMSSSIAWAFQNSQFRLQAQLCIYLPIYKQVSSVVYRILIYSCYCTFIEITPHKLCWATHPAISQTSKYQLLQVVVWPEYSHGQYFKIHWCIKHAKWSTGLINPCSAL